MGLSDTDLFNEVIDELVQTMLESIEDDEGFQGETIQLTEDSKDFESNEDRVRCSGHWVSMYNEAAKKIKQACRKAGF